MARDHSEAVFWVMRKITNSAGFTGAMPIWQIRRPLSMSSWVMVVGPHSTKKASDGVEPARARTCLRMAGAEAGATDKEQAARLLAEAVHGLHLLCKEEEDAEARQELARAVDALADCAREIYAGAANLQELLQKLAAQLNTESLHFN